MCLLPPMCLFCRHYNQDSGHDERDCSAFVETPDDIFRGYFDHRLAYPGNGGVCFELISEQADDFAEVMSVRQQLLGSPV